MNKALTVPTYLDKLNDFLHLNINLHMVGWLEIWQECDNTSVRKWNWLQIKWKHLIKQVSVKVISNMKLSSPYVLSSGRVRTPVCAWERGVGTEPMIWLCGGHFCASVLRLPFPWMVASSSPRTCITTAPNCHLSLASFPYGTVVVWPQYPSSINKGNVESQITLLSFRMILCYIFLFLPGRKELTDFLIVLFLYLFKLNPFIPWQRETIVSYVCVAPEGIGHSSLVFSVELCWLF